MHALPDIVVMTSAQRVRKRIEEIFGWGKDVGPIRKTKFRGKDRVGFQLLLTLAGYNPDSHAQYSCRGADMTAQGVSERCETDKTPQAKANATDKFNSIARHNQRHCLFDNAATTNQAIFSAIFNSLLVRTGEIT